MAKKRRYYRENRRPPHYMEEDWDDDEECEENEDDEAETERFVKNALFVLLAALLLGGVLSITRTLFVPIENIRGEEGYRVVSLSPGKLHVESIRTGQKLSIEDQKWIQAALNGSIKRGDVIYP